MSPYKPVDFQEKVLIFLGTLEQKLTGKMIEKWEKAQEYKAIVMPRISLSGEKIFYHVTLRGRIVEAQEPNLDRIKLIWGHQTFLNVSPPLYYRKSHTTKLVMQEKY